MSEQKAIEAAIEAIGILEKACPEPGKQNTAQNNVRRAIGQLKGAVEIEERRKAKADEERRISARRWQEGNHPAWRNNETVPTIGSDGKAAADNAPLDSIISVALMDRSVLEIRASSFVTDDDWVYFRKADGGFAAAVAARQIMHINKQV